MKIEQIDLYELEVPPIPVVAKYRANIFNLTVTTQLPDMGFYD